MTEELHFCLLPKIVKEHQYNPEAFQVEKLHWQMDYQGWKAPDDHSLIALSKSVSEALWFLLDNTKRRKAGFIQIRN
ncbi:hypothetical protein [Legionella bozemanae]|uniref:hypothetical protein n=1 Tax=Legionella bozemanae TaxID=447 RepID=UPI00399CFCC4